MACKDEISSMEEGVSAGGTPNLPEMYARVCSSNTVVTPAQKFIAEVMGTYFVIFAGCGAVAVNKIYGSVTFVGICVTWGLIVMVMINTVGHISGVHFNPAVTITLTIFRRFPLWQLPLYIATQLIGSILASVTRPHTERDPDGFLPGRVERTVPFDQDRPRMKTSVMSS